MAYKGRIMKYIDAEKLIAVLERQNADKKIIQPLIRIIDSLQQEQSEVDLKKELDNYMDGYFSECQDGTLLNDGGSELQYEDVYKIARHFYELGRTEGIKGNLEEIPSNVDLEKDVESWVFNEISSKINVENTMYHYFQECAHRYYNLGLNARKEE